MATLPAPVPFLEHIGFSESPRWHEGRLWFSEMFLGHVRAVDLAGRSELIATLPARSSGLGWLPDGRLLVVSVEDRCILRREADGSLVPHAGLSTLATGSCNDMVVDARGNAYVGNFGVRPSSGEPPAAAVLACAAADGTVRAVADDLVFPNGMVITPGGRTLVVAETFANRLTAFDVAADGSLGNRRTWAETPAYRPDGIALDADGCIWMGTVSDTFVRVAPGGRVLDEIRLDGCMGVACALGGEDRKTLFLCTTRGDRATMTTGTDNGVIWTVRVPVAGAGRP